MEELEYIFSRVCLVPSISCPSLIRFPSQNYYVIACQRAATQHFIMCDFSNIHPHYMHFQIKYGKLLHVVLAILCLVSFYCYVN